MATNPRPVKARLTLPTQRALWLAAQFVAGEFSVVKISPPMPTKDTEQSNIYFDLVIEEQQQ